MYMKYNVKFSSLQTVHDKTLLHFALLLHCCCLLSIVMPRLPAAKFQLCVFLDCKVIRHQSFDCVGPRYVCASLHNNLYELYGIKWFYTALINVWIFASMDIFRSFTTQNVKYFWDYTNTDLFCLPVLQNWQKMET